MDKPTETASDATAAAPEADPELDIHSEQFNPLKALLVNEDQLLWMCEDAPVHDNVAMFESRMKRMESSGTANTATKATKKSQSTKAASERHLAPVRRFQPHQGLVQGAGKKARHSRNLLRTWNANAENEGPLNWMERCRAERRRVKILLRNESSINGHASGIVEAYDKHWNIVLSDVVHVWKRKKPHFCATAAMPAHDDDTDECMRRLQRLGITVPAVNVKSINRKFAECTRRVPQLVIRGEQIAVIHHSDVSQDHSIESRS